MSFALNLDFPTGSIVQSADSVVPPGWVACDGAAYNGQQDAYRQLWELIGTTYGGSGQTSFIVPNLGGRVPVGVTATASGTGINGPVGSWDGATAVTLTTSQTGVPLHTHSSTWDAISSTGDPGHSHATGYTDHAHFFGRTLFAIRVKTDQSYPFRHSDGSNGGYYTDYQTSAISMSSTTITGVSISNNSTTTPSAHTNYQPSITLSYLIKL